MTDRTLDYIDMNPAKAPDWVVVWLHGLGADGHDFEAIVPELTLPEGLSVRFVFPHAPRRPITINMGMVMRGWYDIRDMDLSMDVDFEGIDTSARLLGRLLEAEIERGVPSKRIVLAGFSQGGVIVLHAGLRFAEPLAGIMALSTYCPTLPALIQERAPSNAAVPIMMAHGIHDPLIPIAAAKQARDGLANLQYHVQWHEYAIQHEIGMEELAAIREWLLGVMT